MGHRDQERGVALTTALMLLSMLMALLSAYFVITRVEMSTTRWSMDRSRGFYAAEAGLNLRAVQIRQTFIGYNVPAGTAPEEIAGELTCLDGSDGTGDFACQTHGLQDREVLTHVTENETNPSAIIVPRGEPFQDLSAIEYAYRVNSSSLGHQGFPEALLEMHFRSRLVPMFQFAAFYDKDLEILPGPNMTLAGPVHSNGDLYLDCDGTLSIDGQTTTAGNLFHGRKNTNYCSNIVEVFDPASPAALAACVANQRVELSEEDVVPWNGQIRVGVDTVTVPEPEVFGPTPGALYWDRADLRLVLDLDGGAIEVRSPDGTVDDTRTASLAGCGAAAHTDTFYDNREGSAIEMLDVDAEALLDCIHENDLMAGRSLDDATEGGLVWYLTVEGPDSDALNNYGVRVHNGMELASTVDDAPEIRGLTIVSNQPAFIQGHYNNVDKKPASLLSDSLNILSTAWSDGDGTADGKPWGERIAGTTTVNAAFLAGTDVTGNAEGTDGQDAGDYNGGLENYPRFHENWSGRTLIYRGSFVSLYEPQHVDGNWHYGDPVYTAPVRDWGFDTDFSDAANLPPLSPRFVYLRQDLFVRHFEM